jgi:hypothetical protein
MHTSAQASIGKIESKTAGCDSDYNLSLPDTVDQTLAIPR